MWKGRIDANISQALGNPIHGKRWFAEGTTKKIGPLSFRMGCNTRTRRCRSRFGTFFCSVTVFVCDGQSGDKKI